MRRIYEYNKYLGASASKDLSYNFYLPMTKKNLCTFTKNAYPCGIYCGYGL
jgi:hypothetical protein